MLLSALIWLPIAGAIGLSLWPIGDSKVMQRLTLGVTVAVLILTGVVLWQFDPSVGTPQMVERWDWLPQLSLSYDLGIDGISLPLVVMTAALLVVAVVASPRRLERPRFYYSLVLLIEAGVLGVFLAQNLLLFFLFYEVELLPLYFLIAIWGGARRTYAATKFLLYTALSGILLLGAFFVWGWLGGSFLYDALGQAQLTTGSQVLLLIPLLLGLAIKIPLVPLHTWLPDAHVEASTPVSVLLAGVLLKLGTYGLVRFGVQMLPEGWQVVAPWLGALAVLNVLYGSFNALAQDDLKKMVAYSSIAHMGSVLLAAAAATPLSVLAAVAQMVSHGLITALLFLLVGAIYTNTGTRDIKLLTGLMNPERGLPLIGSLMVLGVMASAGIPGMIGFVAEFMVYRSSFSVLPIPTLLCIIGTGLTSFYFVRLVNRVFFGRLSERAAAMPRRQTFERLPAAVLALVIIILGIQPGWLLHWSEATVSQLPTPVVAKALAPEPLALGIPEFQG
ncbi:MAG: NADH-quinone oxidoreductase subunit M [Synechococcales cyanobacterium]